MSLKFLLTICLPASLTLTALYSYILFVEIKSVVLWLFYHLVLADCTHMVLFNMLICPYFRKNTISEMKYSSLFSCLFSSSISTFFHVDLPDFLFSVFVGFFNDPTSMDGNLLIFIKITSTCVFWPSNVTYRNLSCKDSCTPVKWCISEIKNWDGKLCVCVRI